MKRARAVEECRNCGNGVPGEIWKINDGLCDKCKLDTPFDYSNDGRDDEQKQAREEKGYEQNRVDQASRRGMR